MPSRRARSPSACRAMSPKTAASSSSKRKAATSATGTSHPPSRPAPVCPCTLSSDTSSDRPEDWGHVHFAESTRGQDGITYWNPLRSGALSPFHDYGPPVIDAIITSLPPAQLRGLVDLSVKAHDNTPIAITQPQPPGWHGLPVTPARIRWRLSHGSQTILPWQVQSSSGSALHPDIRGNSADRHQLRVRLCTGHHTKHPQHSRHLPLLAQTPIRHSPNPQRRLHP